MELVFSPKHFHHLACRHDGEELLVIILLYLAYLQINIVHPTYRTLAGVIIIGIDIAQLAHFVEERALFLSRPEAEQVTVAQSVAVSSESSFDQMADYAMYDNEDIYASLCDY